MKKLLVSLAFLGAASLSHAQQSPAFTDKHDWSRVQSLRLGTTVLLNSTSRHGSCKLKSVESDSLTCTSGPAVRRAEIKSVKLARRGTSALAGFGIGAATGVIAGYVGTKSDGGNGSFDIVSRGDVAAGAGIGLGVIGAIVGFFTHFASSTVYHV